MSNSVHLIGIKGVGMTALAAIYKARGWSVTGSDTDESFVTDDALKGIEVSHGFQTDNVTKDLDLVVYSGAYNETTNVEIKKAFSSGIKMLTQQEALAELTNDKDLIAVAGVGGKTTTTSMIAYILAKLSPDSGHFIGAGKVSGLSGPGKWGDDKLFVAEADEYANIAGVDNTPKLLLLHPRYIVTTNILHDHPDIYPNVSDTIVTFKKFVELAPKNGAVVANIDDPLTRDVLPSVKSPVRTYGTLDEADFVISGIEPDNEFTKATIKQNTISHSLRLPMIGTHNVYNAAAALALTLHLGFNADDILSALSDFKGVGRRQELMGSVGDVLFYDDYAHHPHEITSTIRAFKSHFPDRRLWVIFESHTFTRTQTLFDAFASSLALADHATIAPIFSSARENPSDFSITNRDLSEAVVKLGGSSDYLTFEEAESDIPHHLQPGDIVLTMGAGFVYKLHDKLASNYAELI